MTRYFVPVCNNAKKKVASTEAVNDLIKTFFIETRESALASLSPGATFRVDVSSSVEFKTSESAESYCLLLRLLRLIFYTAIPCKLILLVSSLILDYLQDNFPKINN